MSTNVAKPVKVAIIGASGTYGTHYGTTVPRTALTLCCERWLKSPERGM